MPVLVVSVKGDFTLTFPPPRPVLVGFLVELPCDRSDLDRTDEDGDIGRRDDKEDLTDLVDDMDLLRFLLLLFFSVLGGLLG